MCGNPDRTNNINSREQEVQFFEATSFLQMKNPRNSKQSVDVKAQ